MAAPRTKQKSVKTASNKMYTVLITCPSFGQGIDDIDLTEGFRTPARVIEVLEMSVEDTDKTIVKLSEDGGLGTLFGQEGHMIVEDVADDVVDETEDVADLGDIFPDGSSTDDDNAKDIDFMEALDKLDEEDDLSELETLVNDGLPEL